MIIKILGEQGTPAYDAAKKVIQALGHTIYTGKQCYYDLSVAPLLTQRVSEFALLEPLIGTLIFHPSPLPYGRGPSAIRWAYERVEPITAATWFWANNVFDGGDICEQEIIKIDHTIRPKEFYDLHMLPALERTLERCLNGISKGVIRRVPQVDRYSSYDTKFIHPPG